MAYSFSASFSDFRYPGAACPDIVFVYAVGIFQRNLRDAVVIADHSVGPCPLIFAIVGIDFLEALEQLLDGLDVAFLHILNDALFLSLPAAGVLRGHPSRPRRSWRGRRGDGRVALQHSLQHGTHVDAQGDIVVFDALVER